MKHERSSALVMKQVSDLLAAAAGVDARSLETSRLQWVIEARCRHLKIADTTLYPQHLAASAEELKQLVDATVVRETRFFRDAAVFEHLQKWLPVMAAQFQGELRILSAPCSTGQEAYSVAAMLVESGVPVERFSIDALDISHTALEIARHGHYPDEALKHVTPPMQRACGVHRNKQWVMHNALREQIRFRHCNLALPDALSDAAGKYHLVLCRNLFIYLHAEARAALAQSLSQALAPGGRLILGSADRVEEISRLFAPIRPASSFAFTHRMEIASTETSRPMSRARAHHVPVRSHKVVVTQKVETLPPPTTAAGLYRRALDDQKHGDLRRAERRCRQALYLDPQMLPAMELLESLWREHPNMRLRRALGARIQRSRTEKETV